MKLFTKIFLFMFVSFAVVVFAISYLVARDQISSLKQNVVQEQTLLGTFLSKQVEVGYFESNWPFESLGKLSECKGFLFWWIVRDDGIIHLADKASFIRTAAKDYFPEIALMQEQVTSVNADENYGVFFRPLGTGKAKWSFWYGFSLDEISEREREILFLVAAMSVSALLAVGLALFFGLRHFTKPIKTLSLGASIIGRGDLSHRVRIDSRDEISGLAQSFNQMADNLLQSYTALRESEGKYRLLAETAKEIIVSLGIDGTITYVNEAALEASGYREEEVLGRSLVEIIPEDYFALLEDHLIRRSAGDKGPFFYDAEFVNKKGERIPVEVSTALMLRDGSPAGVLITARDISERKRAEEERRKLEEQLWQARKAESLGRMAGAIAHHYNNLLGVVLGNLELTQDGLRSGSTGSSLLENIAEAMKASRRAADVSHLMLSYLGQGLGKREPLDLADACRRSLPSLSSSLPKKTGIKSEFPGQGPVVRADEAQMKQVLKNLVVNAAEAIGDGEGDITLTIAVIPAADIRASRVYPAGWEPKAESYACLSISDTGCGMEPETMDKAFDPFFSTKFTGRGLGLPVVMGTMKAHEGAIAVESRPGQGATFQVFLPVVTEKPVQIRKVEKVESKALEGRGLVLLVEDDPMLRRTAQTMLKMLDYDVITAADGVEAMDLFRQHQGQIRCVLCDLTMPRMDGWATLKALRGIQPDLPVILCSGYDEAQVMGGEHPHLPQAFLPKPYTMASLKAALAEVLRERLRPT